MNGRISNGIERGIVSAVLLLAVFFSFLAFGAGRNTAYAADFPAITAVGRTIKVGVYLRPGIFQKDPEGNYSGYDYEFLQDIAQYTGWDYEMIEYPDFGSMYAALERGDVELCGGFRYTASVAETFTYVTYNYGIGYHYLALEKNHEVLKRGDLTAYDEEHPFRVSVESYTNAEIRDQIAATALSFGLKNRESLKLIDCPDNASCRGAAFLPKDDPGYADAYHDVDMNPDRPKDARVLTEFSPYASYFVVNKDAGSLAGQTATAIRTIMETNPSFAIELKEKYFGVAGENLILSDEEYDFIASAPVYKVGISPKKAPIQFVDSKGNVKGIGVDVLEIVSARTGLKFEYVAAESHDELVRMLTAGEVDLTAAIPYDYDSAERANVSLTRPFMVSPLSLVISKTGNASTLDGKTLALPAALSYAPTGREKEIVRYEEIYDCLDAVERGECDFAYGNANVLQYYLNQRSYKNLVIIPQNEQFQKLSIAISKPADPTLLSIFNKTILTMKSDEIQAIIMRNMGDSDVTASFYAFLQENSVAIIVSMCLLFLLIIGGVVAFFTVNLRKNRRIAMESSRYKELSALTNEYIFEYDFDGDKIKFNVDFARDFGLPEEQSNFVKSITEQNESFDGEYRLVHGVLSHDDYREDHLIPNARGEKRWLRVVAKTVRDKTGRRVFSIGKFTDVQDEKEEQRNLEEKAKKDGLTGLWNAVETKARIAEGIRGGSGAMIVIDADRFKMVNDTYGHIVGDRVLETIARLLKKYFSEDLVGRIGGDEFCVFLKDADESLCKRIAAQFSKLQRELGETRVEGFDRYVTVSAGMAVASGITDFETLYREADREMYEAKARGGRCFVYGSDRKNASGTR